MSHVRGALFSLVALTIFMVTASASAQDYSFRDWSDVSSVCPSCDAVTTDVLQLTSGQEIQGNVVAINADFYTVERFGEIRTVPASQVSAVNWKDGSQPAGIDALDQIVLNNGHVLTGELVVENEAPAYMQLRSATNDATFTVFATQAAAVYRAGQVQ
ncbi:hypothetical protein FRC96_20860 [Lujinxingia vulgaris]|uniref:Uncharacterized protein n=1 Tax=Lujinxingia vulgaris TaxID=2600176 RepID=A0A5C6X182_9DELT|nr:hypothetical protein [Lujinxingia vulgaris]TXD31615.1 hypothetical protein FRC96_20860 [Lujinxingia vulgaris]